MPKTHVFTLLISVIALVVSFSTLTTRHSTPEPITTHEAMTHNSTEDETSNPSMMQPTLPGQDAFGAMQEIISILEADPDTDWSRVNLESLRQHLIDMHELTLHTQLVTEDIPDGIHIIATAETPRTIAAIQRMVVTHDQMTLQTISEWDTTVTKIDNGIDLRITAEDEQETAKLRGLGFIGIIATGADHPTHHLMMARGEMHNMAE